MTTMTRFAGSDLTPEMFQWLESAMPFNGRHSVAVEEFTDDHNYVLRAELPGRDPQTDISLTVNSGNLTITAKRERGKHEGQQSEFRYGGVTRMLSLPAGVKPDDIRASYDKGILEIRIPVSQSTTPHRIPVSVGAPSNR